MNYYLTILLLLSIFSGCLKQNTTQTIAPTAADSSAKKHWPISSAILPLSPLIDTSFSDEEKTAIQEVSTSWNGSSVSIDLIATGTTTPPIDNGDLTQYRDSILGIYKVQKWFPEVSNNALAITQFFATVKTDENGVSYYEITHADIMVNYANFTFSLNPSPYSLEYDLKSVVLHELGHFLGLDHVNDLSIDSVMHPTLGGGEMVRSIYQKDIDNIEDLYLSSGISQQTANPNAQKGEIRGIIELKSNGRCHTYLLPVEK